MNRKMLPFVFLASLAGCSSPPSLVGTWVHTDAVSQQKTTWTFAHDGTFTEISGSDQKFGQWTATNDTLVATSGDQTITAPIYVNDHDFVFGALRADLAHKGSIAGTWSVDGSLQNGAVTQPYDASWAFGDDGTAFASILDLDGKTHTLRGTWVLDGVTAECDTEMERDGQGSETHRFVFIDGTVLGEQVYARQ
jgi:hypothetical protein